MDFLPDILPLPDKIEPCPGMFELASGTAIVTDPPNVPNAELLRGLLAAPTGFPLPIRTGEAGESNAIVLRLDPRLAARGDEGYRLEVRPDGVLLAAATPRGIGHAVQTLRQLLPAEVETSHPGTGIAWRVRCLIVEDQPRFSWRGFMLDEARHFHGREAVLQILDLMALHKLNVFHWHLTDDQGWRLAIRGWPRLTEVGAWRAGTSKTMLTAQHNGIPHGGSYTRAEISEIVAYAGARHITIVPEIDLPGHSTAALAAYPEFSCTGGPFEVATRFGIFPDLYCAGQDGVLAFLTAVFDEVVDLFPSPFLHIGGDEAPKSRWKHCPACQSRIRELGLKDEHALQVWLTNRIAAHLAPGGRRIIGWNQILGIDLHPDAVIQYWVGDQKELARAVHAGRQVIMSTFLDTYLDHNHSLMPLSRAYRYEPSLPGLDPAEAGILGVEFPLWGEFVHSRARLEYQAFPRLCAVAEAAWTPRDKKNYPDFRRRLEPLLKRLGWLGVGYAPLDEAEPPKWRQFFGPLTIPFPQTKTAR
ncbi:MAG: beta-N-acetylhexosaminidase [Anaerolineales bacterium]|nr:beta-N-acetylhexosaminidase [Anaerolineales bacterium]